MKCNQESHRSLFLQHPTCLPRLSPAQREFKFHRLIPGQTCTYTAQRQGPSVSIVVLSRGKIGNMCNR
jgi:hypothetical protein